jgi:hypothetical protein
MLKLAPNLGILMLVVASLVVPVRIWADPMSSEDYKIQNDAIAGGGDTSTSANYSLEDTLAESATPSGENLASANYKACAGFQCIGTNAELTVNYAVSATPCTSSTTSTPPFNLGLGALSTGTVATVPDHVCIRVSSKSTTLAVAVNDAYGGLASQSKPTDIIASNNATLSSILEGYGACSYNVSGGFIANWPYDGACDATHHSVGGLTTGFRTLFSATGTLSNAYGDMLIKASTTSATPAHSDYEDTLTIVVTPTY